jgi:ribosomal protein L29
MTEKKPAQRINAELIYYQLAEIKSELADFKRHYVTKDESAALKTEINELRKDIADIKKSKNLVGWLYPTVSAAFGALFTYLIIEYFKIRH